MLTWGKISTINATLLLQKPELPDCKYFYLAKMIVDYKFWASTTFILIHYRMSLKLLEDGLTFSVLTGFSLYHFSNVQG